MNYSELTDLKINKLVNKKRTGKETIFVPDYCNNPSDAWPIILEYGINITNYHHSDGLWYASNYFHEDDMIESDAMDNPLRAAMIVYLMMGDNDE